MNSRDTQRFNNKRDAANLPESMKKKLTRISNAAKSGDLSSSELLTLKDELHDVADAFGKTIAVVNASIEFADAKETKMAAREEREAAKVA